MGDDSFLCLLAGRASGLGEVGAATDGGACTKGPLAVCNAAKGVGKTTRGDGATRTPAPGHSPARLTIGRNDGGRLGGRSSAAMGGSDMLRDVGGDVQSLVGGGAIVDCRVGGIELSAVSGGA